MATNAAIVASRPSSFVDRGGTEVTPETAGPRADEAPPISVPKSIILFSDGTGNSSGKLFKTNVYKLYEALDLGPDARGNRSQIAYYDNGVGTSSVKILAILGGVFGFGLKRNVINLYRFLCRNYAEGDKIYAFGFSRGAFTIRLLVALIGTQGIVGYEDERELSRNTIDAYRRFASINNPDFFPWLAIAVRWIRNGLIRLWRAAWHQGFDVLASHRPRIAFVGVWDTVAAYGGPVAEITRAIDKWIWPLTMTDYELGDHVDRARHALALDDERDSFWPLLWDEVHETRKAERAETEDGRAWYGSRLKQVWFAGMHSDVGGGYPDESLSYVPLNWMIGELGPELRLLPELLRTIQSMANIFGPIHDSRKGLGGYYRYQPRRIEAFLHPDARGAPPIRETLSLRDPTVGEKRHRPQGLLLRCRVHDSVVLRIGAGTDNYAPIVLPFRYEIVATTPAAVETPASRQDIGSRAMAALEPAQQAFANLRDEQIARARAERQEVLWDFVLYRRLAYFATVLLSLILAASPLWIGRVPPLPAETDGRWIVGIVIGWLGALVPSAATPWFTAFSEGPAYFVLVGIPILCFGWLGVVLERVLRDRTRRLWWSAMQGEVANLPTRSALQRVRESFVYQWSLQQLKWRIAPTVVGIAMILAIPYAASVAYLQAWLAIHEPQQDLCHDYDAPPPEIEDRVSLDGFEAGAVCNRANVGVVQGHRYRVTFGGEGWTDDRGRHHEGWSDGGHRIAEGGGTASDYGGTTMPTMLLGSPFRRVVPARWLEPLVEVRAPRAMDVGTRPRRTPAIDIDRLTPSTDGKSSGVYGGEFVAARTGGLDMFLNDAVLPWGRPGSRYDGDPTSANRGRAQVSIEDMSARREERGATTHH